MKSFNNRQWIYSKRPEKLVSNEHYSLQHTLLSLDKLKLGEAIIKAKYFSVDPYMRIQQSVNETWEKPHPLNVVQQGAVVGQITDINTERSNYQIGDWVLTYSGWQDYAKINLHEIRKLNPYEVPVTTALGILGMPARIAYFGLLEAGNPQPNETVVVSGASGAVGQVVVQIAKIKGCKVVGIAGSDDKLEYLKNELGVDEVINYKLYSTPHKMKLALKNACPNGIDIYYDNVGGYISDSIFELINLNARIIVCGQISQYSGGLDNPNPGPRFLHHILYKRAKIQGVLARDYNDKMDEMLLEMTPWVKNGLLKYEETIVEGFNQLPDALNMLFLGKNKGKLIVKND